MDQCFEQTNNQQTLQCSNNNRQNRNRTRNRRGVVVNYQLFKILIIGLLIIGANAQLDFLTISIDEDKASALANYTFEILQWTNIQITSGSNFVINFPLDYQSILTVGPYNCFSSAWPPGHAAPTLSCSVTNLKLTIQNGFPLNMPFSFTNIFQIIVQNIRNPLFAGTTAVFTGSIEDSSSAVLFTFESNMGSGVPISQGLLGCSLSASPTQVNSLAQMIVSITPSNTLPISSTIQITTAKFWPKNAVNNTNLFIGPANCLNIANASFNIQCISQATPTLTIITVTNVVDADTSSPIRFSISSIYNPPTTEPQGTITILTKVGNKNMEQCSGIKMSGITTAGITSVTYIPTDYTVNAVSKGFMSFKVTSIIKTSDSVKIGFPATIDLTSLSSVTIVNGFVTLSNPQVDGSNVLTLNGLSAQNNALVSIEFNNVKNPPSEVSTNSFTIGISRDNFLMEQLKTSLRFTARRALMTSASISSSTLEIGVSATYTISCQLSNPLNANSVLIVTLPSAYSSSTGFTCSPSPCSISGRIIQYSSVTSITGYPILTLTLNSIVNPLVLGTISTLILETRLASSEPLSFVETANSSVQLTLTARKLLVADVTISSDSSTVYNYPTTFTVTINNKNPIPGYSYIQIELPPRIFGNQGEVACTFGGLGIACQYNATTNKVTLSSISQTQQPISFLQSRPIQILNLYNPSSTRPTQTFKVSIINNINKVIEFLDNSLTYVAPTAASFNSLSLVPNNTQNSALTSLTVSFSTSMGQTNNSAILLSFPSSVDTQTISCIAISANLLSISCTKGANVVKARLVYRTNNNDETSFKVDNYKNFPSLQPYSISVELFETTSQLFKIASSSVLLTNSILAPITIHSFSFSNAVLLQESDITFSITPQAIVAISKIEIVLPGQFGVTNAGTCVLPVGLSCSLDSSKKAYSITTLSTFSFPLSIILQRVTTPRFTPSTALYIQTYSNSYLMDRDHSIQFSTKCTLPCKACSASNPSLCTSCYSDGTLVSSQTSLTGNQCQSVCPLKQYLDSGTSTCKICSATCETCQNFNECLSCNLGTYLANPTCVGDCPFGFYQFGTVCAECPSSLFCESCDNSSKCLTCQNGYFMYQTICVPNCPTPITYPDTITKQCKGCPNNCTQCQLMSPNVVDCTVCSAGYLLDNGRCYLTCQTVGTVPSGKICTTCNSICLTCVSTTTTCTTCDTSSLNKYLHNNFCLQTCPNSFFQDTSTFTCKPCTSPCQLCTSVSVSSCVTCITGYLRVGSSCTQNCPPFYYADFSTSTCKQCQTPCSDCNSQTECKSCQSTFYLYGKRCVSQCDPGMTVINGNECLVCQPQCKTCSSSSYCTSCYTSSYLYNGNCTSSCQDGTYPDNTNFICVNCIPPCDFCSLSSHCLTCLNSNFLIENGDCVALCTAPLIPINKVCTPCDSSCTTCQTSVTRCLTCPNLHYFYPSNNSCSLTCTLNQYLNNSVKTCITACPVGMYSLSTVCTACPIGCLQCLSELKCSVCDVGNSYSMYLDKCYNPCPSIVPNSLNGKCVLCIINQCKTCANSTHCSQCRPNFIIIQKRQNSECITQCPSGKIYNSSSFVCQQEQTVPTPNPNPNTPSTGVIPQYLWLMVIGGVFVIVLISKCQFPAETHIVVCAYLIAAIFTLCSVAHILYIQLSPLSSLDQFVTLPVTTFVLIAAAALFILLDIISILSIAIIRDYALIGLSEQRPVLFFLVMVISVIDNRFMLILQTGLFGWSALSTQYIKMSSVYLMNFLLMGGLLFNAALVTYGVLQLLIPNSNSTSRLLLTANNISNSYAIELIVLSGLTLLTGLGVLLLNRDAFFDSSKDKQEISQKGKQDQQKLKQLLANDFNSARGTHTNYQHNESQQELHSQQKDIFERRYKNSSSLLLSMGDAHDNHDQLLSDQFSQKYKGMQISQPNVSQFGEATNQNDEKIEENNSTINRNNQKIINQSNRNMTTSNQSVDINRKTQPVNTQRAAVAKESKQYDVQVDMDQWIIKDFDLEDQKDNGEQAGKMQLLSQQKIRQMKSARLSLNRNMGENTIMPITNSWMQKQEYKIESQERPQKIKQQQLQERQTGYKPQQFRQYQLQKYQNGQKSQQIKSYKSQQAQKLQQQPQKPQELRQQQIQRGQVTQKMQQQDIIEKSAGKEQLIKKQVSSEQSADDLVDQDWNFEQKSQNQVIQKLIFAQTEQNDNHQQSNIRQQQLESNIFCQYQSGMSAINQQQYNNDQYKLIREQDVKQTNIPKLQPPWQQPRKNDPVAQLAKRRTPSQLQKGMDYQQSDWNQPIISQNTQHQTSYMINRNSQPKRSTKFSNYIPQSENPLMNNANKQTPQRSFNRTSNNFSNNQFRNKEQLQNLQMGRKTLTVWKRSEGRENSKLREQQKQKSYKNGQMGRFDYNVQLSSIMSEQKQNERIVYQGSQNGNNQFNQSSLEQEDMQMQQQFFERKLEQEQAKSKQQSSIDSDISQVQQIKQDFTLTNPNQETQDNQEIEQLLQEEIEDGEYDKDVQSIQQQQGLNQQSQQNQLRHPDKSNPKDMGSKLFSKQNQIIEQQNTSRLRTSQHFAPLKTKLAAKKDIAQQSLQNTGRTAKSKKNPSDFLNKIRANQRKTIEQQEETLKKMQDEGSEKNLAKIKRQDPPQLKIIRQQQGKNEGKIGQKKSIEQIREKHRPKTTSKLNKVQKGNTSDNVYQDLRQDNFTQMGNRNQKKQYVSYSQLSSRKSQIQNPKVEANDEQRDKKESIQNKQKVEQSHEQITKQIPKQNIEKVQTIDQVNQQKNTQQKQSFELTINKLDLQQEKQKEQPHDSQQQNYQQKSRKSVKTIKQDTNSIQSKHSKVESLKSRISKQLKYQNFKDQTLLKPQELQKSQKLQKSSKSQKSQILQKSLKPQKSFKQGVQKISIQKSKQSSIKSESNHSQKKQFGKNVEQSLNQSKNQMFMNQLKQRSQLLLQNQYNQQIKSNRQSQIDKTQINQQNERGIDIQEIQRQGSQKISSKKVEQNDAPAKFQESQSNLLNQVQKKPTQNLQIIQVARKTNRSHVPQKQEESVVHNRGSIYSAFRKDQKKAGTNKNGDDYNSQLDDASVHNLKNIDIDIQNEQLRIQGASNCIFIDQDDNENQMISHKQYQDSIKSKDPYAKSGQKKYQKSLQGKDAYVKSDKNKHVESYHQKQQGSQLPSESPQSKKKYRIISFEQDLEQLDQAISPVYNKKSHKVYQQEDKLEDFEDNQISFEKPSNLLQGIHNDKFYVKKKQNKQVNQVKNHLSLDMEAQNNNATRRSSRPPLPNKKDRYGYSNHQQIKFEVQKTFYNEKQARSLSGQKKARKNSVNDKSESGNSDVKPSEMLKGSFKKIGQMVLEKGSKY